MSYGHVHFLLEFPFGGGVHAAWADTQSFLWHRRTTQLRQSHTLFIDEVGQTVYLTGGPNLTPSAFLNLCHMPHPHMLRAQLHRRASAACVTTRSGSTLDTSDWSGGAVWPASLQY